MVVRTAVVLAAGEGTRLRPLTRNRPKPMLPAANQPILEHVFDALIDAGVETLVVVVGYRHDRVQEYFGPTYRETPIEYVRQQKQLGSGHALLQARSSVDGPALVVNGDRLIDAASVERVRETFEANDNVATMGVIERGNTSRYGVVTLADQYVEEIIEKPDTDAYRLINAGIYAFGHDIFEEISETPREDGELALTDTLGRLVDQTAVRGVHIDGLWVDATYPWDLLEVATEVLERGRANEPEREAGVWVDSDAQIHEDATMRPPVVVGPDSEIGPGSVVGPNVAIGHNCTIGPNATVERAVIDSDSRIGAGSTLLDAVFGQDVHVGVNTTIPGGPSDVRVGNHVYEEQMLGAVLADRVESDGNVVFESGTLVAPGATIGAGAVVDGWIGEGAEVVR